MAVTLWHVTRQSNAEQITEGGFRNGAFREMPELKGVYFSDRPMLDGMDGVPSGYVAIAVIFNDDVNLAEYEVIEEGVDGGTREWFIPADVANKGTRYDVRA